MSNLSNQTKILKGFRVPTNLFVVASCVLIITACSSERAPANFGNSLAPEQNVFSVSGLRAEAELAASIGKIKDLQYTYAQYGQYGLWDEMSSLFSDSAEILIIRDGEEDQLIQGLEPIRRYLMSFGNGSNGLPVGWLNNEMYMAPVVTLRGDGSAATGRWQTLNMRGQVGGDANWSGGFQVNDYVKEEGVWKFKKLSIHEQFEGPYETGWFTVGKQIPFIPYHYTSSEAGAPIPAAAISNARSLSNDGLTDSERDELTLEIEGMIAADEVNKMQNIYGYYADRKMWDDVADLFLEDAVLEIAGLGIYEGADSIRRGLERDGPVGLQTGQVHDQVQMHTVVAVDPNGVEARARGMQWGFLTPELGKASFMISTFQNRFLLKDGIWQISEMRIYPQMHADYSQGWHKDVTVTQVPTGDFAPDRLSAASNSPQSSPVIPEFFINPVTGRSVVYPDGFTVTGADRLTTAVSETTNTPLDSSEENIRERLVLVSAVDAIENISSTFGYYLDDYQWQRYAENYGPLGWRRKGGGQVYEGPDAIYKAESLSYGPSPTWDRDWIRPHTRMQPVIDINADAESAFIRTRMVLYFANSRSAGAFNSGMYPSDSAVLVDGVWKMNIGGWIDETYFSSRGYKLGWANPFETPVDSVQGRAPGSAGPGDPEAQARRASGSYPATLDPNLGQLGRRAYGVIRGQPGFKSWPEIKPMWFHYVNPVSGRVPEFYCADSKICVNEPMDAFVQSLEE